MAEKSVSSAIPGERIEEIEFVSKAVFGKPPTRVAFPGGNSRSAFVADVDGKLCVFAKRRSEESSILEAKALKAFAGTGNAPEFIARHKQWIVQECVPGTRLPVFVDQTQDPAEREQLMRASIEALLNLHHAADRNGLQHRVAKVGATTEWTVSRLNNAKRIAACLKIEPLEYEQEKVAVLLDGGFRDFVKRDARPGNALVLNDRHLWFDFEDCGRRNAIDDLVWVLADEWTGLDIEAEERLLGEFLPRFNRQLGKQEAEDYFYNHAIVHMLWRLRLIVEHRAEKNEWWNRDMCLAKDKIGVTPQEAARVVSRLFAWRERTAHFGRLEDWARNVTHTLRLE